MVPYIIYGRKRIGFVALLLHQYIRHHDYVVVFCFIGRKEAVRLMRTDPRLTETTIYLQSNNKTNEIIKIMLK